MSESHITLQEIGQALLARRLERGFTLADVAASTNLRTFFLSCMEEGKFNELPGGIYTRGLAKIYITWLEFDDAQCEEWLNHIQQPSVVEKKSPIDPSPALKTFPLLWGLGGVGLVIAVSLYVSREHSLKENKAFVVASSIHESDEKTDEHKKLALFARGSTWIKITDSDNRIVYAQLAKKDAMIDLTPYIGKNLTVGDGRQVVICQNGAEVGPLSEPSEDDVPVFMENLPIQVDSD